MKKLDLVRAVNQIFDLRPLLAKIDVGLHKSGDCTVWCPFHQDDREGGTRSAKFFEKDNALYCWTCARTYKPYNVLSWILKVPDTELRKLIPRDLVVEEVEPKKPIASSALENLRINFIMGKMPFRAYLWEAMEEAARLKKERDKEAKT